MGGNQRPGGSLVDPVPEGDISLSSEILAPERVPTPIDNPFYWAQVVPLVEQMIGFELISPSTMKKYARIGFQNYRNEFQKEPEPEELVFSNEFWEPVNAYLSGTAFMPELFWVGPDLFYNDQISTPTKLRSVHTREGEFDLNEADFLAKGQGIKVPDLTKNRNITRLDTSQFEALKNENLQRVLRRPGTGRGRQKRAFDEAALAEAASQSWRALLLEDAPSGKIQDIVSSYISSAQAFWMDQGGSLDFDTFLRNKIRDLGRYQMLYGKKDAHVSEEEWIGGFVQQAQRHLPGRLQVGEIERAAQSGASAQGFGERISRSRTAQTANQGEWSHRFANSVAGLGQLARS